MSLEQQISRGIMEAMKARDTVRLAALRNIKKYIIEAKTAQTSIAELSDEQTLRIIGKLAKQGQESADIYLRSGREELAREELAQVEVMREFLPRPLSGEELAEALRAIIERTGAESLKDMGRVMGIASKELSGRADGKEIAAKVRELLA